METSTAGAPCLSTGLNLAWISSSQTFERSIIISTRRDVTGQIILQISPLQNRRNPVNYFHTWSELFPKEICVQSCLPSDSNFSHEKSTSVHTIDFMWYICFTSKYTLWSVFTGHFSFPPAPSCCWRATISSIIVRYYIDEIKVSEVATLPLA